MFVRMTDHNCQRETAGGNIPETTELIGNWQLPIWNGRTLVNEGAETPATTGYPSTSGTPEVGWSPPEAAVSGQLMYDANQGIPTIPPRVTVTGVPPNTLAKVTYFPEGSVSPPGFSPIPTLQQFWYKLMVHSHVIPKTICRTFKHCRVLCLKEVMPWGIVLLITIWCLGQRE